MVDLWEYECEGAIFYAFKIFSTVITLIITLNDHHGAKATRNKTRISSDNVELKSFISKTCLKVFIVCACLYSLCILMVSNRHDVIMFVTRILLMVFTTFDNRDP